MEIKIGLIFYWIFCIVSFFGFFNPPKIKFVRIIIGALSISFIVWCFIFGPIYFYYLSGEPLNYEQSLFQESKELGKSIKRENIVISLYNAKILKVTEVEYSGAGSRIIHSHLILRI
jgi:hypothetical protein